MQNDAMVYTVNAWDFFFFCLTTLCVTMTVWRLVQYISNQRIAKPSRSGINSTFEHKKNSSLAQPRPHDLSYAPNLTTMDDMEDSSIRCPFVATPQNSTDTDGDTDSCGTEIDDQRRKPVCRADSAKRPKQVPKDLPIGHDSEEGMDSPLRVVSSTPEVRVLRENIEASLSDKERAEEQRIRSKQMARIHSLMQSQPDRFGSMSISDMQLQMDRFYADGKHITEHPS
ncbi:unnamed protein product [Dicrocoelium dendriticum]|nr:unnamed protein product [Dicrocoelium dendriticum]